MYINLIDKEGHEETVFNLFSEKFYQHVIKKQDELNKIGVLLALSYEYKPINSLPEDLYQKAVSICYEGYYAD